jgi:hypothetical protein
MLINITLIMWWRKDEKIGECRVMKALANYGEENGIREFGIH